MSGSCQVNRFELQVLLVVAIALLNGKCILLRLCGRIRIDMNDIQLFTLHINIFVEVQIEHLDLLTDHFERKDKTFSQLENEKKLSFDTEFKSKFDSKIFEYSCFKRGRTNFSLVSL